MKTNVSKFKSCTAFLLALVMVVTLLPGTMVLATDDATDIASPGYDSTLTEPAEPGENTDPVDPELELQTLAAAAPFALGDLEVEVQDVAALVAAVSTAAANTTVTLGADFEATDIADDLKITATIGLSNNKGVTVTVDGKGRMLSSSDATIFKISATSGSQIILKNFVLDGNDKIRISEVGAGNSTIKSNVSFENCAFLNGYAMFGGAISADSYTHVEVKNCSFIDNSGYHHGYSGGAIALNQAHYSVLKVNDSYFKGNVFGKNKEYVGQGGTGGAISLHNTHHTDMYVDNCVFDENKSLATADSTSDGGAIAIRQSGLPGTPGAINYTISNSTFYMNETRDDGGAILIQGLAAFKSKYISGDIYNCTFVENRGSSDDPDSDSNGGAIQVFSSKGRAYVYHNTFYGNTFTDPEADYIGGAISASSFGIVHAGNNLFVDNSVHDDESMTKNTVSAIDKKGNIGFDNGKEIIYPKSAVEFGTDTPELENLYDSDTPNIIGYLYNEDDYSTEMKTLRVAPEAEADNAAITVPSNAVSINTEVDTDLSVDQNGRARGDRLTAGAVEVNWVKYDANGGSWENTTVASQTGYNDDGTTYYHATNNKDAYYTVHANYDDEVLVTGEKPKTVDDTYEFLSWNTKPDGTGTTYTENAILNEKGATLEYMTLYAIWDGLYTVIYDANYEENKPDDRLDSGHPLGDYTVLENEFVRGNGYTFKGWSLKSKPDASDTLYAAGDPLTLEGNTTLFAQWDASFTLTYSNPEGKGADISKEGLAPDIEHTVLGQQHFTHDIGYIFDCWNTEEKGGGQSYYEGDPITLDKNTILYAQWYKNLNITYHENWANSPQTPAYSTPIRSHQNHIIVSLEETNFVTPPDHFFIGWLIFPAPIPGLDFPSFWAYPGDSRSTALKDIPYYAQWTDVGVNVTFNANSGKFGNSPEAQTDVQTVEVGKGGLIFDSVLASLPELSREGYVFDGKWYRDPACADPWDFASDKVEDNITLYAGWTKQHTVTFDANGGEFKDAITDQQQLKLLHESLITDEILDSLPALAYPGHTFGGWYTDEGCTEAWGFSTDTVTEDFKLYAKWTKDSSGGGGTSRYKVAYDANGGKGQFVTSSMSSGTVHTVLTLGKTGITNSDYRFIGWSKTQTGGVDYDPGDEITVTKNIKLYAQWENVGLDYDNHFAYIIGYPDGSVRPNGNITRAEVSTVFLRLLTQDSRAELWKKTNDFSDVAAESWYNNAVSTLANGNILKGYPDGTFLPDGSITRAEFAAIAARFATAEDIKNKADSATFTDISGHWAEEYIKLAGAVGFLPEYSDGPFMPDKPITRAEVATMLNHVLKRQINSEDDLQPGYKAWPDNLPGAAYYFDILEATNSHKHEASPDGIGEVWTKHIESPNWSLLVGPDAKPGDLVY